MSQPIKRGRNKIKTPETITGTGDGIDYCNECPFLGYQDDVYICNPNDYVFGKRKDKIPVPKWCGNHK